MKQHFPMRTPFRVWLASLPLALSIPLFFWLIEAVIYMACSSFSGAVFCLIMGGFATAMHLLTYLATGTFFFLTRYKSPDSRIWKLPISLMLGGSLGIIILSVAVQLLGYPTSTLGDPAIHLMGAGYGLATAFAAHLQRSICNGNENAHDFL